MYENQPFFKEQSFSLVAVQYSVSCGQNFADMVQCSMAFEKFVLVTKTKFCLCDITKKVAND